MLVDLIVPGDEVRPLRWTGDLDYLLASNNLPQETEAEVRAALASPDRETGLMAGGWVLRVHEEDDDA